MHVAGQALAAEFVDHNADPAGSAISARYSGSSRSRRSISATNSAAVIP
jgi:hypothetical protein